MSENVSIPVPIKIIKGDKWLSSMNLTSKAKVRSVGMDNKSKRVQDEGKHHCFEINVEGNIICEGGIWNLTCWNLTCEDLDCWNLTCEDLNFFGVAIAYKSFKCNYFI